MKLPICLVLLVLVGGCDPEGSFVVFTDPWPYTDTDSGVVVTPVDEDAGVARDARADSGEDGGALVEDAGRDVVDATPPPERPVDAGNRSCRLFKHWNGTGQYWEDCVLLETYDEAQAMKACSAYTEDPGKCSRTPGCGTAPWVIQAENRVTHGSYLWGYEGNTAGWVGSNGSCPNAAGQPWG